MGIIGQGILGGLSGKVGNVIGASWKGIHYIRIKPMKVANPRTVGQVNQRNKFRAMLDFLKPNLSFIRRAFKKGSGQTAMNAAMAYNIKNAITGIAPDFEVDYALAQLSSGSLTPPVNASQVLAPGEATISWDNNTAGERALDTDRALLLAYNPAKDDSVMLLDGAFRRDSGSGTLAIPQAFIGDTLHFYVAFQSATGGETSGTAYAGSGVAI